MPNQKRNDLDHIVGNEPLALNETATLLLAAFLSVVRKSKSEEDKDRDEQDTRDVLQALSLFGYAILPQGTIGAIKRLLTERQELPVEKKSL